MSHVEQKIYIEFFIVKTVRTKYIRTHCHQGENTLLHGQSTLYINLDPVQREVIYINKYNQYKYI